MEPFVPAVWPEAVLPGHASGCMKCALSAQRKKIVWGEGNPEAGVYVLLDNPGARETPDGTPFVCGTRETLQKAAYEAGFRPEELFVTYLLKCRPVRAYDKEAAREACLPYLYGQLEGHRPKVLFVMGNVAVRAVFRDPAAEAKHLRGQLHPLDGLAAAVTYHPLAVRRRPSLFPNFLQDWLLVARYWQNQSSKVGI